MMSGVNVDLYHKDELEFEIRSRGKKLQGDVASLRKQLRNALAAGDEQSGVKLTDVAAEIALCQEKWEELQNLSEGFVSPSSTLRARQRARQSLQHLYDRLKNLATQPGTTEIRTAFSSLTEQVSAALQGPLPSLSLIHI